MIARAAGFMISVDDLQKVQEVSDAVLEGVAGGAGCIPLAFNGSEACLPLLFRSDSGLIPKPILQSNWFFIA